VVTVPAVTPAVTSANAPETSASGPVQPSAPAAAPPPANANVTAPVSPRADLLDTERPAIRRALALYQNAYREKNVRLLESVFPTLPRERKQAIERSFKDCRDYDVEFTNFRMSLSDDPSFASVRVRTTYTCQPRTGQSAQPQTIEEVFELEKVDSAWLIESAGTMNSGRVR